MGKRIILFELNEVPFRILDYYADVEPASTLAAILKQSRQYVAYAADESHLKPWKTWPTVHRGVNDQQHLLHDFGQDLSEVDKAYPPVWDILTKRGVRTGVFASLHTYPMPDSLENYAFYFPDTFAASSECFPDTLTAFQDFNLSMARESGRNVSRSIPWRSALNVLSRASGLGLRAKTFASVGKQLVAERVNRALINRRRTYQCVLAFDVFMKQLESTRPEFTTFFTNHVASALHRYWVALFPEDYDVVKFEQQWLDTYTREIWFTMHEFDAMLRRLVSFVDGNNNYQLWITGSMGQEAVESEPIETQVHMEDTDRFLTAIGVNARAFTQKPAMVPQYNFETEDIEEGKKLIDAAKIVRFGEIPLRVRVAAQGRLAKVSPGVNPATLGILASSKPCCQRDELVSVRRLLRR